MPQKQRNNSRRVRARRTSRKPRMNIKTALNGTSFRVNPDPTPIVDRPWNNATISFAAQSDGNISVATVHTAVLAQLLSERVEDVLEYRFQEFRAWELSGLNLAVDIFDLDNDGDTDVTHRSQRDEPGRNHWAAVGLKWSSAQSSNTLTSGLNADTNVAGIIAGGTSPNIRIHIRLIWRFLSDPGPARAIQIKPSVSSRSES